MHEMRTPESGGRPDAPAAPSAASPARRAAFSGPVTERPDRHLALVAMMVGVGALLMWSQRPRRRAAKRRPDMPTLAAGRGLHVERTMTVQRSRDEVYRAWRDLEGLPRLLPDRLVSVTSLGPGRSRWRMTGPGGIAMTWEAELTADEPSRLLAWRSVPGADVDIAGSVRFGAAPGERGTEIKVIVAYSPPGGRLGGAAAAMFGQGGDRLVREALRRFKQLMETGEMTTAAPVPDAEAGIASPPLARSA
jgi:uncharacterized membrane protein